MCLILVALSAFRGMRVSRAMTLTLKNQLFAEAATSLAAAHRLRAGDALHLATAVVAGADRFITNNRRDFGPSITEIEVVYPDALDEP